MPRLNLYETELINVLQSVGGHYITAYQAFRLLEDNFPLVANALSLAYPMPIGNPPMGKEAGEYYSPASYISHAYNYLRQHGHQNINKETFAPIHTELGRVEAGADDAIAIWSWRA